MTSVPPLDPFSEVLDERRRWMPDWYQWLTKVSAGDAFTDLIDAPNSYAGQGGKLTAVKTDETGLEFVVAGSGGTAPVGALYVTLGTSAMLTNERVLTAGTNITVVDSGAGNAVTINSDPLPHFAVFQFRSDAAAADLSGAAMFDTIETKHFDTAGDRGGAVYVKVPAGLTATVGTVQSADGGIWTLRGPILDIRQFGAKPDLANDGSVDASAAINQAIDFCNNNFYALTKISFADQVWAINAPLNALNTIFYLQGDPGFLVKHYVEADPVKGVFNFGRFMPTIRRLGFSAGVTSSGGSWLNITNPVNTLVLPDQNSSSVGNMRMEECVFSAGAGVNYNLYIDGTNSLVIQGARNIWLSNLSFFAAALASVRMSGVRNVFAGGCIIDGTSISFGTTTGVGLEITGSGAIPTGNFNYDYVAVGKLNISNSQGVGMWGIAGQAVGASPVGLSLTNVLDSTFHATIAGDVAAAPDVFRTRIVGRVTGTVPAGWSPGPDANGNKTYI